MGMLLGVGHARIKLVAALAVIAFVEEMVIDAIGKTHDNIVAPKDQCQPSPMQHFGILEARC